MSEPLTRKQCRAWPRADQPVTQGFTTAVEDGRRSGPDSPVDSCRSSIYPVTKTERLFPPVGQWPWAKGLFGETKINPKVGGHDIGRGGELVSLGPPRGVPFASIRRTCAIYTRDNKLVLVRGLSHGISTATVSSLAENCSG